MLFPTGHKEDGRLQTIWHRRGYKTIGTADVEEIDAIIFCHNFLCKHGLNSRLSMSNTSSKSKSQKFLIYHNLINLLNRF